MIDAFAAAVLGGFGSLGGVVIGAFVIGMIQQVLGGYVLQSYAPALPFVIMLAVLAVRPQGLVAISSQRL